MAKPQILQIVRIGLTVTDLDAIRAFYEQALGFAPLGPVAHRGDGSGGLLALDPACSAVAVLGLGRQRIELAAFDPPGRPYPTPSRANDPWFQHLAIAVSDMDKAWSRLSSQGDLVPISDGGPQRLPPSTGSIIAVKFRDPDGHPLELSWFPPAVRAPQWSNPPAGAVCLGVDHSAIAVTDLARSMAFYADLLGLTPGPRLTNHGPTQARLDGLPDPVVDIQVLTTPEPGPHLELLAYRTPRPAAAGVAPAPEDVAATRLVCRVHDLAALLDRLPHAPLARSPAGDAALVRDPDGHLLQLAESAPAPGP